MQYKDCNYIKLNEKYDHKIELYVTEKIVVYWNEYGMLKQQYELYLQSIKTQYDRTQ